MLVKPGKYDINWLVTKKKHGKRQPTRDLFFWCSGSTSEPGSHMCGNINRSLAFRVKCWMGFPRKYTCNTTPYSFPSFKTQLYGWKTTGGWVILFFKRFFWLGGSKGKFTCHSMIMSSSCLMTRLQFHVRFFHDLFWGYPSSNNHGSEKWVPPIVVRFQIQPFFHFHNCGRKSSSSPWLLFLEPTELLKWNGETFVLLIREGFVLLLVQKNDVSVEG